MARPRRPGLAALERAAVGEFRTQGGEHERPVGVVGGERSRAISRTSTLSASVAPTALKKPRSLARAAATSRSVSPRSAARRAASRSVSRKAGSPVWRWAVPSPMARSSPRTGSGSSACGVEVEGLGVVAEGVGRGQGAEGGVARLARVADGLGQVDGLGGVDPVAGQFAHSGPGAVPAEVLQRLGHLPVGPGPAGRTQVLVRVCWMRAWAKL